jgi:hypothetical protein
MPDRAERAQCRAQRWHHPQRLFTILVFMALITTVATGSLLSTIGRMGGEKETNPRLPKEPTRAEMDDLS